MPTSTPDASFLAIITAWIAAAVAALFGWIWMHTMGRLKALEQGKVDQREYEKGIASSDAVRAEIKASVHELSAKLDLFKDDVGRKFDELKNLILEQRK